MTVLTVFGPVNGIAVPAVWLIAMPAAAMAAVVPCGDAVQIYDVEVANGKFVMLAVDGDADDNGALP